MIGAALDRAAASQSYAVPERRRRQIVCIVVAIAGLVAVFFGSLILGTTHLSLGQVLSGLFTDGPDTLVVRELRLPRVACALAVGAALALAGALTQAVTGNPLASPDIIGVTSGASVGAVTVITFAGSAGGVSGLAGSVGVPTAAILGGLAATALVAAIASGTERVVLVGVGVTAMCQSAVTWLLVQGDVTDAGRAATWLAGSLNGRTWADAKPVLIGLTLAVPLLLPLPRLLSAIALGPDVAQSLGVRVERVRRYALGVAAVLAGLATAAAGPVAFVGLCAPAIAVRSVRGARPPLLLSALLGAVLVGASDLIGRNLFGWFGGGATQLPVGVVSGALGAAYLVLLVQRKVRG